MDVGRAGYIKICTFLLIESIYTSMERFNHSC